MNLFKLLFRNLKYYSKEHLLLLIGLVLSTAVLTSALIIGDSVKYSLNDIVSKRLGNTNHLIVTQERYLPANFSKKLSDELNNQVAPLLLIRGMASSDNSETRLPNVQVCGVNASFWKVGNCIMPELNDNELVINSKLAAKLNLSFGDELFVRAEKVSFVSNNAPFVPDENNSIALRMEIKAIADENSFGNFDIKSNQITPYTVFFSIEKLSKLNFEGIYSNLMLVADNDKTAAEISTTIKNNWSIKELNLKFKTIENQNKIELSSDRIFIDDTVSNVLTKHGFFPENQFTYLINSINANQLSTPYSFVSALSHYPNYQLNNTDIIINKWLADDLKLKIKDTVKLQYYTLTTFRKH